MGTELYTNELKIHYHFHYARDAIGCGIILLIFAIFGFFLMIYMNREYRTDVYSNIEKGEQL